MYQRQTDIHSGYEYYVSRLFGTSSLFSAHHTFIDMRKNMRKRYEKKCGAHQGREREEERQIEATSSASSVGSGILI